MVAATPFIVKLYREALALTEAAAAYHEGMVAAGDAGAALLGLTPKQQLAVTTESLRLTVRLMQVMAWLMVQRAVAAGEISLAEARTPERRLGGREPGLAPIESVLLPATLNRLIAASHGLYRRVARLEDRLFRPDAAENPVHRLIGRLE